MPLSPSLSPEVISRHRRVDLATGSPIPDPEIDALATAVTTARTQATQMVDLADRLAADLGRPPAEAAVTLAQAAPKIATRGTEAIDKALTRVTEAAERLAKQIAAPAPVPGMAVDAEVRAAVRELKPAERRDLIGDAIARGDDAVIGAVLRGPAMLSGLDSETLEGFRQRWQAKHRPEESGRLRRLQAAQRDGEAAGTALLRLAGGYTRAPALAAAERRAEAEAAVRQAQEG